MNEELFFGKVRNVTAEDRKKLPIYSYSGLDVSKTCPFQYNKKYNEKLRSSDTNLALELGGLCHYVLEQKGKILFNKQNVDYSKLNDTLKNGTIEINKKTREEILGIDKLKRKYFETWYEQDNASGMNYEEKMQIFDKVLRNEMEPENNDGWKPLYFEQYFEFVWDDRAIIRGFIDRIDCKDGEYRTIDYKTSKKVYDKSKLATSLQFGIYAVAILNDFKKLPIESIYRFILIDDLQYALTKGWEKRFIKALDKILDQIDEYSQTGLWMPKPSPLCYWCDFCALNPNAHAYKRECEYYSLWTPNEKSFKKNKEWNPDEVKNTDKKRKLIF